MNLENLVLKVSHNFFHLKRNMNCKSSSGLDFAYLIIVPRLGHFWQIGLLIPIGFVPLTHLLLVLDHVGRDYLQT